MASSQIQNTKANMDSSDIFTTPCLAVLDRRLDIARFPCDNSMYPLIRSWIQDNPIRQIHPPVRLSQREGLSLPCPKKETSKTKARLVSKRHMVPTEVLIHSLPSVPPKVLLQSHLIRLRLIRKWWKQRYIYRRERYRSRLIALGVPIQSTSGDNGKKDADNENEKHSA